MKTACNPFLPLNAYIPDGEPHVYGDRLYLFGSHDQEGGDTFCALDYEFFSCPVDDLSDWTSRGINYSAKQDPLYSEERPYMYAPDVVQGNDGRFYLYYCLSGYRGEGGYFGPISVAFSAEPDGRYEFLGHVKNKDGSLMDRFVAFDPALINDDGVIRLYYGTYYPFASLGPLFAPIMKKKQRRMFGKTAEQMKEKGGVMGPIVLTLEDDMVTVKDEPKRLFDPKKVGGGKMYVFPRHGRSFLGHGFFEGSSIRKIDGLYYFIYSSLNNHELCYATSLYPDRDFVYRGVIVSTGDVGLNGRKEEDRLNHTGTTHGSIANVNGQWYVFYHRQTHGSDYSRQAMAEPIAILPDGSIPQVEVTSSGLSGAPLPRGEYSCVRCADLTNGHMPHGSNQDLSGFPMITSKGNERFLTGLTPGTQVIYKYCDFSGSSSLSLTGRGKGKLTVYIDDGYIGDLAFDNMTWESPALALTPGLSSKGKLAFIIGEGELELLKFAF